MSFQSRLFNPLQNLMIPVVVDHDNTSSLTLARNLGGRVKMVGFIKVSQEDNISAEVNNARHLREKMADLSASLSVQGALQISVTEDPYIELQNITARENPDLLILEWPNHIKFFQSGLENFLSELQCDVAVIRGTIDKSIERILIPIRGGPNAELSMRLGLSMPHTELLAIHLKSKEQNCEKDNQFIGLERILPKIKDVVYQTRASSDPEKMILTEAQLSDLVILGAGVTNQGSGFHLGELTENILNQSPCDVIVVKTQKERFEEVEDFESTSSSGYHAISILVDKWFAENTYHAGEFDDLYHLVSLKQEQKVSISLAMPALNEEKTVGKVIETIKTSLMDDFPLLDEIVLMDSNSTDSTRDIVSQYGVPTFIHQNLLTEYGSRDGKGEALWKSLLVTNGDIIIWIDTDIVNIHPRFVYGVIGPMLVNPEIQFVKGFYRRPIKNAETLQSSGGGRVTELTARPLLNLFYPELSGVIQPLSGEYGGRRKALEQVPFYSGYGVEIGLLIDIYEKFGLSSIAQVDLLKRIHHNQPLEALSKMSAVILQAVIHKLETRFDRPFLDEINKTMKMIKIKDGNYRLAVEKVVEKERPPMLEVQAYIEKHIRKFFD